ncbi:MAG: hypothetical protein N3F03_02475 [Ignavibacteria bacterium]|nr:hypothetical protein [Ignavibacteria bacterium]
MAVLIIFSVTISSCLKEVSEPIEPAVLKKLKLIPADPVNIIYLNLKSIKRTKLGKNFLKDNVEFPSNLNQSFFDSLGINFKQDVDEIIIATQWDDINTFIITLNKPLKLDTNNSSIKNTNYTILDDKILVLSNSNERIKEIETGDFENSFTKNPLFRRMINSVHYKEHFWFMTQNKSALLKLLKNGNSDEEKLEKLFYAVRFINFSVKFDRDLNINSHWECIDVAKANLLKSVINGLISALALTEPNDPLVREISKSEIFLENKGVEIFLKISPEKIELIKQSEIKNKIKRLAEHER